MAIETGVKEVLETDFAGQIGAGEVRFRIIDVAKLENGALADKYEVAWSALLLNKWRDGKETVTDLTRFAFANARTNPEQIQGGALRRNPETTGRCSYGVFAKPVWTVRPFRF